MRPIANAPAAALRVLAAAALLASCGLAVATPIPPALASKPKKPSVPSPYSGDGSKFTVIGLPDTQFYSQSFPQIFAAQTQWVVDQQKARNIKFVSHYGDLVQNGDNLGQWANAKAAMNTLLTNNIPHGVVPGNHDVLASGSSGQPFIPQNYLSNFGPQVFAGKDYYGGASPSGLSSFQRFNGAGREYLALHLSVDTPIEELAWAQGVLNTNRHLPVMVTTHRYLQDAEDYTFGVPVVPSGRYPSIWYSIEGVYDPSGIQSEQFYEQFIRTNPNIFLVNCGHFHEEFRQTSTNVYGNPVHEVLADYQDDPNGGNGWLRIMEFDVPGNTIRVDSYSPTLNEFRSADESKFSLDVNWNNYASQNTVVFQQGINGYTGTQDTWISEANKNTSYGNDQTIVVDDDVNNSIFNDRRGQGMIRFDDLVGTADWQVPAGATITSANLKLHFADDVDSPFSSPDFFVHLMTADWNESSTWNTMGGNGLTPGADYSTLLGILAGDNNPDGDGFRMLDVTDAVQLWANGVPNFGFAILPEIISGNDDGIEIWSSEFWNPLLRPVLEVTWTFPAGQLVPAPGAALALLAAGTLATTRRRQR